MREKLELSPKETGLLQIDSKIDKINTFIEDKPLGNRMKEYENLSRFYLPKEYPMIIRVDGNAFHTFTRSCDKPFDEILRTSLELTAKYLVENIPGAQMAYHQSDEISILVTNYQLSNRQPWFDNNINKIVSITAAMASTEFNRVFYDKINEKAKLNSSDDTHLERSRSIPKQALFDSRVFVLPKEEVTNYFIWRQQDAIKNSISMVSQSLFSHKSLQGLKGHQMIEKMLVEKGIVYEDSYTVTERRGSTVHRLQPVKQVKELTLKDGSTKTVEYERSEWGIDSNIPIFKDERDYIEKFI